MIKTQLINIEEGKLMPCLEENLQLSMFILGKKNDL
jgi:hypothetical protein